MEGGGTTNSNLVGLSATGGGGIRKVGGGGSVAGRRESVSLSLTVVVDKTSDCEQGEDPLALLPCRLRCLGQV